MNLPPRGGYPRAAMRPLPLRALPVALLSALGCGDDDPPPADFAGEYTLAITNGASTCPLDTWTEGTSSTGVPLTIAQDGDSVTVTVGGAGAVGLGLLIGAATLEGTVDGDTMTLTRPGTRAFSAGSCAFTIDARAAADLDGDALTGEIVYRPNANDSPDCAGLASCKATQRFNGTRPPR